MQNDDWEVLSSTLQKYKVDHRQSLKCFDPRNHFGDITVLLNRYLWNHEIQLKPKLGQNFSFQWHRRGLSQTGLLTSEQVWLSSSAYRKLNGIIKRLHWYKEQDQNLIIARGNLRATFSYYIFVPHFVLQKSIIGSLPLSRRKQKEEF